MSKATKATKPERMRVVNATFDTFEAHEVALGRDNLYHSIDEAEKAARAVCVHGWYLIACACDTPRVSA